MPFIPEPRKQWYVVHVLSGQEKSTAERLKRFVEAEELGEEYVFDVLVPTETVSEVKKGEKKERQKKFFPGYIIVNMWLYEEDQNIVEKTWYAINQTDGIIGFAGTKDKPIPMRQREVDSMLNQIKAGEESARPTITFEVGETIKVADGPFESQNGVIEEIDSEKGLMRVAVSIFGRSTPVELEFWQAEKI